MSRPPVDACERLRAALLERLGPSAPAPYVRHDTHQVVLALDGDRADALAALLDPPKPGRRGRR